MVTQDENIFWVVVILSRVVEWLCMFHRCPRACMSSEMKVNMLGCDMVTPCPRFTLSLGWLQPPQDPEQDMWFKIDGCVISCRKSEFFKIEKHSSDNLKNKKTTQKLRPKGHFRLTPKRVHFLIKMSNFSRNNKKIRFWSLTMGVIFF